MKPIASDAATYSENGTRAKEEIGLESGEPIQAWIEYDGFKKLLNATLAPINSSKPIESLLSEPIDLSNVVKDKMYAGFSAATGKKFSSHYILGWSFKLNGMADPLNIDRLPIVPHSKSPSTSNVKLKRELVATFSVMILLLLIALGNKEKKNKDRIA